MNRAVIIISLLGLLVHNSVCDDSSSNNSSSSSSSDEDPSGMRPGSKPNLPNIIFMIMDDMGFADISVNGNVASETPNIDQMARDGIVLKDWYSASPLCSPTRAALLTGRLPPRTGFYNDLADAANGVLFQVVDGGINSSEHLLPELLSTKGYRSKMIGKWHLGHQEQYLPLQHGFDEFFGSPSNYLNPLPYKGDFGPKITMYANDTMVGRFYEDFPIETVDGVPGVSDITQRYIWEAEEFIKKEAKRESPFFLNWAPDATHTPVYASKEFRGKSPRGIYGDAVMEIDSGVGRILNLLKDLNIDRNTWVFFSSDNGAATYARQLGGDNGPFICGKMTTYEGGMRVPTVVWAPGNIAPGQVSHQVGTVMDFFSTALALTDIAEPDVTIDGNNILPFLLDPENNGNEDAAVYYWRGNTLMAIRKGWYKVHFHTLAMRESFNYPPGFVNPCYGLEIEDFTTNKLVKHEKPLLFHLGSDEGEKWPLDTSVDAYARILAEMIELQHNHLDFEMTPSGFNMCDPAVQGWAPKGCENTMSGCMTPPASNPEPCYFGF